MNPTLGAILLGLLSLPIVFQLYFGYAVSYLVTTNCKLTNNNFVKKMSFSLNNRGKGK
jgi:hypothetical protein